MQDLTTLQMHATAEIALKHIQEDEYYSNIMHDGIRKTLKSLKQNPYPGLRPFKASESNVFFGRKEITFELISRLATNRFLAVLGASGSGKSSLVRAGLLPGLKTLPGKHGIWKVAVCRPGKNPFGNLALAISKAGIAPAYTELEIWKSISSSSYGFEEMYNSLNSGEEYNTLIVIDQFEELFRFKKDHGTSGKNDAAIFVKMLIDISKIEKLSTYVMITMRSEYLGDCVQFPDLTDEINSGQFLVPRMKFNQLRDAIMEPAAFSNASVERVFADRLIGEIGDNMDQLPVLQHALRRSYEEAKNNKELRGGIKVIHADYDKIGRMEFALDKHAEEIMQQLDDNQKKYCRILFQSITDRATDGRGIRRPLSLGTIYKICTESKSAGEQDATILADLKKVIDCFRVDNVNFLMPPENVPLQENTEIDISHESLMRIWKQLVTWIEKEARDADLLKLLLSREEDEYIKGGRLLSFKEWAATKRNALAWAGIYKPANTPEKDYTAKFFSRVILIDRSAEIEKEEEQLKEMEHQKLVEEQRLKARRRLNYIFLILALFLITFIGGIVLLNMYKILGTNKKVVELQNKALVVKDSLINNRITEVNKLNDSLEENKLHLDSTIEELETNKLVLETKNKRIAKDSASLADKNTELSAQIESLNREKMRSDSLFSSLQNSTVQLENTTQKAQNLQNLALAVKHAEKSLAIPAYDIKRINIKAQLALLSYKLLQESGKAEIEKLQPQIYSGLYNAIKGTSADAVQKLDITHYPPGTDRQAFGGFSAIRNDQPVIYLTAEDRNLHSYNLQTGKPEPGILSNHTGNNKNLFSVQVSRQGKWMAINTLSDELLLCDLEKKGNTDTSFTFGGTVRSAKFSPDGNSLFVYTKDSNLHSIDLKKISNRSAYSSKKINYILEDLAVSRNFIYGVTSTGNVVKWNRNSPRPGNPDFITIPKDRSEKYRGTKIACSPDDQIIVWGNEHGEVFYFVTGKSDTGQNLTRFGGPVTDIAFSETGNYLAVASYDKSVRVFQLPNLQAEAPIDLRNNEGPVTGLFFQRDKDNLNTENLFAVISPGSIRIFPMDLSALACKLEKVSQEKPSEEDQNLYFDKQVVNKLSKIACNR